MGRTSLGEERRGAFLGPCPGHRRDEQPRELEQRPQLETRHPTRPSEARFHNAAANPRRGTRSVKNSGSVRYVG